MPTIPGVSFVLVLTFFAGEVLARRRRAEFRNIELLHRPSLREDHRRLSPRSPWEASAHTYVSKYPVTTEMVGVGKC